MFNSKILVKLKQYKINPEDLSNDTKFFINLKRYENDDISTLTKKQVSCDQFDLSLDISLYRNETSSDSPFQTIKATFNKEYPELPELYKDHYKFLGYSKTRSGSVIQEDDIVQYHDTNLYGIWLESGHFIFDYSTNGGYGIDGSTSDDYYPDYTINYLPRALHNTLNFSGWYTDPYGGDKITESTIFTDSMKGMRLYAHYANTSYEILDSDVEWELNSELNPDPNLYDGCYQSFSNFNVDNSEATITIKLIGYSSFSFYIRSWAESDYDYVITEAPTAEGYEESEEEKEYKRKKSEYTSMGYYVDEYYDEYQSIMNWSVYDQNWNFIESGQFTKENPYPSTKGNQNSDTSINGYTLVQFNFSDPSENYIYVRYKKDSSVAEGDDRGYLLIPYNQS